jgi:SSS family solute:Na+ symporter
LRDKNDAGKATISWSWTGRKQTEITDAEKTKLLALNNSPEYRAAIEKLQKKVKDAITQDPTDVDSERAKPLAHPSIKDFNSILITVISVQLPEQFPLWGALAASLIIVAIMAASMSTADSNLHALSAVATRDIYDRFIRPEASDKEKVWFGRIVIAAVTVLALVVVILGEQPDFKNKYDVIKMIAQMGLMAIAFSAQLLPVTIDMLFLNKGTGKGAAAGLAVGLFGAFLFGPLYRMLVDALGSPEMLVGILDSVKYLTSTLKVHGSVWGLVLNIPVFVLISLVTRKPDPEKVRQYRETFASNE